jgi:ABC-type nitrate/sulfonate/bicarbonate transport system substrate-binding protein
MRLQSSTPTFGRGIAAGAAAVALALGLGACSSSSSSGASSQASNNGSAPAASNGGSTPTGGGSGTTDITLVAQPNGASLPLVVADKEGFFKAAGLNVTIKYYATGPSSLADGAKGTWQAGWLGAPPALTGMNQFGLVPLGLMIQEDSNHIMFMSKKVLQGSTPAQVLKSHPVATVQNSLGEQVMDACAQHFGVDPNQLKLVNLDPGGVVQALQAGRVQVADAWAPPDYPLINDPNYEPVCTGKIANTAVVDPFVVTPSFAKDNPDAAARYAAAVYAADEFINNNNTAAVDDMMGLYKANGITSGRDVAAYEVKIRQWYTLQQAVDGIQSGTTAKALKASAQFFVDKGVYDQAPPIDNLLQQGLAILKKAQSINLPMPSGASSGSGSPSATTSS